MATTNYGHGITIDGDSAYLQTTSAALDLIYSTATGKKLLERIGKSGKKVSIKNGSRNECRASAPAAEAQAKYVSAKNPIATISLDKAKYLKLAVDRAKVAGLTADKIAKQISVLPTYLIGTAGNMAKTQRDAVAVQIDPRAHPPKQPLPKAAATDLKSRHMIDFTAQDVSDWIEGKASIPYQADAALPWVLGPYMLKDSGDGRDSQIMWDPTSQSAHWPRPAGVSLAHELIHAYYTARGEQLGQETSTIYEYMCVGIGPFSEVEYGWKICENRIRAEWPAEKVTRRAQY